MYTPGLRTAPPDIYLEIGLILGRQRMKASLRIGPTDFFAWGGKQDLYGGIAVASGQKHHGSCYQGAGQCSQYGQ